MLKTHTRIFAALVMALASFAICFVIMPAKAQAAQGPVVNYKTHVQNIGWQGLKSDGATAGTTGKALRLEAIKVQVKNAGTSGSVEYKTHVQNVGWQGWKSNGALSGTTGKKLRLEAIQIKLTGEIAKQYDIYYRVHAQNFGWMGWAKNGASAGTAGYAYRLEAIQIKLVKKDGKTPGSTANAFKELKVPTITGDKSLDRKIYLQAKELGSLRACYDWVTKHKHNNWSKREYARGYAEKWVKQEVKRYFDGKPVDCYGKAATFACLAKALGHKAKAVSGDVASRHGGWAAHAWVEIKIDGKTLTCDVCYQKSHPEKNFYLRTYADGPLVYKRP